MTRHATAVTLALSIVAPVLSAAELVIDNRAPKANEVGYRPADGAPVRVNPPSFIWLHESAAAAYTIQWARRNDFGDAATARGFVWNTYTHDAPIAPGTWYWRYRFTTKEGLESSWSQTRSVVVPPEAAAFPMPTRAQQRQRVPSGHPRLFLRPEDLPRLRELARGREAERFGKLVAEADRLIAAGPTPEPEHMGSSRDKENAELVKYWWPNRLQTDKAGREAETIAFVYLITGEKKYGEAARRWILHLAAWNPDGPTNFTLNCEAGKVMLYRPARAYDWAWDALTPQDREVVRRVMVRRLAEAWESWEVQRGTGHLNSPFGSHANRIWHKIGEAGIAFLGEIPEAEVWLDYAVNKFYGCYPVWSDDDGGWHEGVSYWAGYMSKAVWWLQVAKSALDIDGLKKPFFAQVGDYPLYIAPPGSPNMGFGDLSYRQPPPSIGGFLQYHVRARGAQPDGGRASYWRWWTEQWRMQGEEGVLGFLYAANLPPLPDPRPPLDLPQSKVFGGVGVASLHSTLLDSKEDVHFLFKASPFGTQSHGHNPHNSFQLNAYGEPLLVACTYRDLHGSKFHYEWAHSTVAQNAVLVGGEGQVKHSPAPHGRIVESRLSGAWDYVSGDATDAYAGRLARFRRNVVFVKPDVIVIYDDLEAAEPATFQFMLHALKEFSVDERRASASVDLPGAGVDVRYLSPRPLAFRQWDGFEPKPSTEFPNHWHLQAGTRDNAKALGVLTVLVPYRAGQRAAWTAERVESETALGVRITRGGATRLVGFRKHGVGGPATLDGKAFDAPATVGE
jgi:hypothetical protein